jgi:hypothetical protein
MSRRAFVIASAFVFSGVAATALLSQPTAGPTSKTVRAGEIEIDPSKPHVIRGHFYIGPAKPGEATISSLGYGGACLIGRHPTDTASCKSDDDCTKGVPATGHGYCVKEGGAKAGQCWIKPDDASYCFKIRPPAVPSDGDHIAPAAGWVNTDSEYAKLPAKGPKQISWRVVACLNAYDPAKRLGCANQPGAPKPLEDYGTPKVVH